MKKIDDNTVIQVRVPMALYESIKKQLEKKKDNKKKEAAKHQKEK